MRTLHFDRFSVCIYAILNILIFNVCFEAFMAVMIQVEVFWVVMLCSVAVGYHHFRVK
jgi:hypothetical protein